MTLSFQLAPDAQPMISNSVEAIQGLPGFKQIAILPDAAPSNHETPYGIVVAFEDYVVPQLIGRVVGCAMSLVRIPPSVADLLENSDTAKTEFARRVLDATNPIDMTRNLLEAIYRQGPAALAPWLQSQGIDVPWDNVGQSNLDLATPSLMPLEKIIPTRTLDNLPRIRFPGARFKKNHYVEVSRSVRCQAERGETQGGEAFIAFHFESPLSGLLNSYYSGSRLKERTNGALMSARFWARWVEKVLFHLGAAGPVEFIPSTRSFLRHLPFVPIPLDTVSGQRYLSLLHLITNFERSAQLAFVAKINAALRDIVGQSADVELVFTASHNDIRVEQNLGANTLVARKNTVPARTGAIGYLSGMTTIPSLLLRGTKDHNQHLWMDSYDHGMANHLWRDFGAANYFELQEPGKLSRFEEYDTRLRTDVQQEEEWEALNRVTVIRCAGDNGSGPTSGRFLELDTDIVRYRPSLQHVIRTYSNFNSPVRVEALLVPTLNIKELG